MKVKGLIKAYSWKKHCQIILEKGEFDWDLTYDEAITCEEKVSYFSIDYDERLKTNVVIIRVK